MTVKHVLLMQTIRHFAGLTSEKSTDWIPMTPADRKAFRGLNQDPLARKADNPGLSRYGISGRHMNLPRPNAKGFAVVAVGHVGSLITPAQI